MTKIIGFAYRKRVGKDTCAKLLDTVIRVTKPGIKVKKLSFASKLKAICYDLFGWAGLQPGIFYEDDRNAHLRETVLPKLGKSPRQIWIEVGNKMREIYADVWIDNALQGTPNADVLLITDVRFPNECHKVHSLGGKVYNVVRPDAPRGHDLAEISLDDFAEFDGEIINDGSLELLHQKIDKLAMEVLHG